jgi:hypothetical protein
MARRAVTWQAVELRRGVTRQVAVLKAHGRCGSGPGTGGPQPWFEGHPRPVSHPPITQSVLSALGVLRVRVCVRVAPASGGMRR